MSEQSMTSRAVARRKRQGLPVLPDWTLAVFILVLAGIALYIQRPGFFRQANLVSQLRTLLPLLFLAVGQMVVICVRGIDLSSGSLLTLTSVVMIVLFGAAPDELGGLLAIVAGLAVGVVGGAVNGTLTAVLRLQPIIASFATSFVWAGLALWILPQPGGTVPSWLRGAFRVKSTLPPVVIVLAVMFAIWWAFTRSRAYRKLLAVGGDPAAAHVTGIGVRKLLFCSYVFSGLMAGVGGLFLCADIASGDPLIGNAMTLPAIVTVVIGGTRLTGGNASFPGTVAGALVLVALRNNVFAAGLPFSWQPLVDGALVVVVLAIAGILVKRRGR